jgi:hypothetical protein
MVQQGRAHALAYPCGRLCRTGTHELVEIGTISHRRADREIERDLRHGPEGEDASLVLPPLNPPTSLSRDDVAQLCAWTDAQMLDLSCQLSSAQRNITQFLRWSVSDDVQREGTAGFVDEESANAV